VPSAAPQVTRSAAKSCMSRPRTLLVFAFLTAAIAGRMPAQAPAAVIGSYEEGFAEIMALGPAPDAVADVQNLVLRRDVARFTLASGKLYLLKPIGGRTVAAVFRGKGTFSFGPSSKIEQDRLVRFEKKTSLEEPFTELVMLFADSTMAELRTALTFGTQAAPSEVRDRAREALKYLSDEDSKTFDPDLMGAILNGETTDLFYAHMRRDGDEPLMFMLNPHEVEAVSLSSQASSRWWKGAARYREVLSQFPREGQPRDALITGERMDAAEIKHYTIDIDLPQRGIGEVAFAARAKLVITAGSPVGPWVAFQLFDKLTVDSARWEGGEPATVFKGKESSLLWVRLGQRLQAGEARTLVLSYHGDLIDRIIDFFRIKASVAWYPLSLEGRTLADFDLTFNTNDAYLLASVGELKDSSRSGSVVTTRWVTRGPIRNASFNLGLFKDYTVTDSGVPPVTVMISEEAHKKVGGQKNMRQAVGADMSKSLRFFQSVYGPTRIKHFYATEIPEYHGEAFPGMLHLSFVTFLSTEDDGRDEIFRAHEVAHQWWGIGVDYMTYHDRWLSEGFAEFSGLWYMQTVRNSNDRYFDRLKEYRSSIFLRRDGAGPISLGHRVQSAKDADLNDYSTIVYKKGAWVVHMLRVMMLDMKTMSENRFKETMRDFYLTYEGKRASTADFQRVVERHIGTDMGWFFAQWVDGTALPAYRVSYNTQPAGDGQYRVRMRVRQENVPDDFQMYVPVTLDLGKDRIARVRVKVAGPLSDIELPLMPAAPKSVKFNDFEGVLAEVKMVDWGR
jgi:hypothetical protein